VAAVPCPAWKPNPNNDVIKGVAVVMAARDPGGG
jgi:hypothetical protein